MAGQFLYWMGVALLSIALETEAFIAYMPRSVGRTDDPCGPTLDSMRAAGESGLPNSPYIPPPAPGASNQQGYHMGLPNARMPSYPSFHEYGFQGGPGAGQRQGTGGSPSPTSLPGIESHRFGNVFSASPLPKNTGQRTSGSGRSGAAPRPGTVGSADPSAAARELGTSRTQYRSGSANPTVASKPASPVGVGTIIERNTNAGTSVGNTQRLSISGVQRQPAASSGRRPRRVKRQLMNPGGFNFGYNFGGYNPGGYNPNQAPMYDYDPPEYYMPGQQPYGGPAGRSHVPLDLPDPPPGGFPMPGGYPGMGASPYGSHMPAYAYDIDIPMGYQGGPIDPHTAAMLDLDIPPGMQHYAPPSYGYPPNPRMGPGQYPPPVPLPPPRPLPPSPQTPLRNPFLPVRASPPTRVAHRISRPPINIPRRMPPSANPPMAGPPYSLYEVIPTVNPDIFARPPPRAPQNPTFSRYNGGSSPSSQTGASNVNQGSNTGLPSRPGSSRTGRKNAAVSHTWSNDQSLPSNARTAANNQHRHRIASIDVTPKPQLPVSPGVPVSGQAGGNARGANPTTVMPTATEGVPSNLGRNNMAVDATSGGHNNTDAASLRGNARAPQPSATGSFPSNPSVRAGGSGGSGATAANGAPAGQALNNGNTTQDTFVAKINLQPGPAEMANGKYPSGRSRTAEYGPVPWEPMYTNLAPAKQPYQEAPYDPYASQYQDLYYQNYYAQDPAYASPYDQSYNDPWLQLFYDQGAAAYDQASQGSNVNERQQSGYQNLWSKSAPSGSGRGSQSGAPASSQTSSLRAQASSASQSVASVNPKPGFGPSGASNSASKASPGSQSQGTLSIAAENPGTPSASPPQQRTRNTDGTPANQNQNQSPGAARQPSNPQDLASAYALEPYPAYQQDPYFVYQQHSNSRFPQDPFGTNQYDPYAAFPYQPYANVDIYAVPQEPLTCYCELATECNLAAKVEGAHYNRQCDGSGNFVCCCRR